MSDDNLSAYAARALPDMSEADGAAVEKLLRERDKLAEENAAADAKRKADAAKHREKIAATDERLAAIEAEIARLLPRNPIPPAQIG